MAVGGGEISLVRFGVINFFAILMNRSVFLPTATTLCEIVKSIIDAEQQPDITEKDKVVYIYEHTDERVNEALPIVELAVFKNIDRGLNQTIDIGEKDFTIAELYHILNDVRWKLVEIVTGIAKKYTLEMPMVQVGGAMKTGFGMGIEMGIPTGITVAEPELQTQMPME
jgi:hypothetical protein